MDDNRFYVYFIYKLIDGVTWIYVGKGCGDRFRQSLKEKLGDRFRIILLNIDEPYAYRIEDYLYMQFKRRGYKLLNRRRPGRYGKGSTFKHSEETKQRLREYFRGRVFSTETILLMCQAAKESQNRPEVAEKKRVAMIGKPQSDEKREKLRVANIGNTKALGKNWKLTDEQKQTRSIAKQAWWDSPEGQAEKARRSKRAKELRLAQQTSV